MILMGVASDGWGWLLMGRKIFVFTNVDGKIIGSFTPGNEQSTDLRQPRIATDVTIHGQITHEMEIPSHLPENVPSDILHQELAKILPSKEQPESKSE